ncbi:MAG: hypothetical protein AABX53_03975 [Nanoarchaeota archaeon]
MKKESDSRDGSLISWLMPAKSTVTLFVFFLLIVGLFLFFLDKKTGAGFGFVECAFALVAALLLAALFAWIKLIMEKNPYLGIISGILIAVLLTNALFIKYKGPYTMTFAGIGALGTVGYLMYHFFIYRVEDKRTR